MAVIAGVEGVLAPFHFRQEEITKVFASHVSPDALELVESIHAATGVQTRNLALNPSDYLLLDGFGAANDEFIRLGLDMGEQAIRSALDKAGLTPADVDMIMSVSVTGIAAPSLEARLFPRLGLRPDVKRVPIFGLGCVAGAAGVARVRDYLAGDPDGVAVLLTVELCSLTVQREDFSIANVIACGLFGDGAAAVVMVGAERARRMGIEGPTVVSSRSRMYPDTERMMGWDVVDTGFRLFLSPGVSRLIATNLEADVTGFLAEHDLGLEDVSAWVCHPGGPRILEAVQDALSLRSDELAVTWRSLARIGNLSSASVLHILQDTMEGRDGAVPPVPGSRGLMMSMGPGFCAEMVLLSW